MKRLLTIWLGLLAPWAGAQTHVYFDLAAPFFNALPASNRVVTLQPLTPFPGNSITYTSSASGTFYHSNAFVGDYVGSIRARGLANEIKFQITVTATNLGVVNADTITSLTGQQSYPSTGRASWSIQASDQRFVRTPTNAAAANDGDIISKTGDKTKYVAPGSGSGVFTAAGTNVTAQTNGNVVTINADVSAASVAAKADTNNTTIWNLDARGFQTDSITNLAGNVFALFAGGGGFYFYDPNAGNRFLAGDDTTISLYANAVEVFTGKEDYTEVKAQNTTNKLHISSDGNEFTGPVVNPKISGSTITGSNYVSGVMYFGGGSAVPRFTNGFVAFDSIEIFQGDIIVYNGGEVQATFRGNGEHITNLPSTAITGVITNAVRNADSNYFNGQAHFGASSSVRLTNGWISFNGGIVESGDLIVRDGGEVQGTFRGNGQYLTNLVLTTGTNVWWHNPTNIWSNPSGTIKTRYSDNTGNPRLDFVGQSDTIQFSVFWENSTSGGIYAPYLQGNGSLLTALNASALASGLAPPQRLAPTNSVPVDGTYALFFRSGTNVWLLSSDSVPGISNVLAVNNDAGGLSLSNVNWLVVSNAYYQNFYVDTNYVTNFFLASLASNQVPVASGGGQLLGDTGLTFERTSDTLAVGNLATGKKLLFGQNVTSDPEYASVVGGQSNRITGTNLWSFIGGGTNNNIAAGTSGALIAANGASAIVAGRGNTISYHSTNNGYVINSFIGAGRGNRILTSGEGNSVIVGGIDNTTEASNGFIGGGNANYTYSGVYSVIAGGAGNITSNATHAIIPGGASNYVAGNFSQAAGLGAHALNSGTYVWADGTTATPFASTANNQFLVRAAGGVGINTNNPGNYALVVKGNTLLDGQVTGNGIGLTNIYEKNLVVTTNSWGNAVPDFSRGTMLLTNLAGNLTLTDPTGFVSSNLNWQTIALNPDGATRVITVPEAWYVSGAFTNQTTAALTNGTIGTLRIEALIGIRTNAALEISQ